MLSLFIIFLVYKSSAPSVPWEVVDDQLAKKVPDWHPHPEGLSEKLEKNFKIHTGSETRADTAEKPLGDDYIEGTPGSPPDRAPENSFSESSQQGIEVPDLKNELETSGTLFLQTQTAVSKGKGFGDATKTTISHMPKAVGTDKPSIPENRPGGSHNKQKYGGLYFTPTTKATIIHWTPLPENFPLRPEEVIVLPTASAEPIPPIQFNFGQEDSQSKMIQEDRLAKVKAEMKHAWSGYVKYAWGHDEIRPVSLKFKDPFCGWAATLVDSLDTLWIMGMKDEFDLAVKAVGEIDFTYSHYRTHIPIFETTIRYLGGLLGAYDVSGGTSTNKDYGVLLDKAAELAEVLMGIFDTPNRMPILYYDYKPQAVMTPKMAPSSSGVAELGSLLVEFTRLAQLSGNHKYYDGVARITNAFEDLAKRGTRYNGLFPENLDTSGCNRTETIRPRPLVVPGLGETYVGQSISRPIGGTGGHIAGEAKSSSGRSKGDVDAGEPVLSGRRAPRVEHDSTEDKTLSKRNVLGNVQSDMASRQAKIDSVSADCSPQGLIPAGRGLESYSIGGSQDSAYEYFPKEWLLLGAREPQYKRLAISALEATKNNLLFRPMIEDENREILFSAKITTRNGDPEYDFEVTHLSCFAGGMFGMSGKIFERPEYVEIGKRLTDGCVWAYEVFPNGIMPEHARIVPCMDPEDCKWNKTAWYEWIDPMAATRDRQVEEYDERMQRTLKQQERDRQVEKTKTEQSASRQAKRFSHAVEAEAARHVALQTHDSASSKKGHTEITKEIIENTKEKILESPLGAEMPFLPEDDYKGLQRDEIGAVDDENISSRELASKAVSSLDKLELEDSKLHRREFPSTAIDNRHLGSYDVAVGGSELDGGYKELVAEQEENGEELSTPAPKTKEEAEMLLANPPPSDEKAIGGTQRLLAPHDLPQSSSRPLTHEAFAANRVKNERLAKGFVSIGTRSYILR